MYNLPFREGKKKKKKVAFGILKGAEEVNLHLQT